MKYKYYPWLKIEDNPYFDRYSQRMNYEFWYLKELYNSGQITNPHSNEFIEYSDLLLTNVFTPIFEEFLSPFNQNISKLMREMVNSLITGQFNEFLTMGPEKFDQLLQERLKQEKQKLLDELVRIDEDDAHVDRSMYYEYNKKMQELEEREKEHKWNVKEQEFMLRVMQLEADTKIKTIELAQQALAMQHDKNAMQITLQLIEIQKEGMAQRERVLDIERKLFEIKDVAFESKAREVMLGVKMKQLQIEQSEYDVKQSMRQLELAKEEWEHNKSSLMLRIGDASRKADRYFDSLKRSEDEVMRLEAVIRDMEKRAK